MSNQIFMEGNFLLNQNNLESAYRLANAFYKANCFNETVKNPEQALAILIAGNEAGLKPAESMSNFYFVKGKLQMYGAGLAKAISRAGVKITYNKLTKQEIDVNYSRDGVLLQRLQYNFNDLPATSQAKKFAPEEKLVYHAHSRFLRYNDVGVSVPYTDYDQGVIDASTTETPEVEESELTKFIREEAETVEALEGVKNQLQTADERGAYSVKYAELMAKQPAVKAEVVKTEPPLTSDGALLEDKKPTTNV